MRWIFLTAISGVAGTVDVQPLIQIRQCLGDKSDSAAKALLCTSLGGKLVKQLVQELEEGIKKANKYKLFKKQISPTVKTLKNVMTNQKKYLAETNAFIDEATKFTKHTLWKYVSDDKKYSTMTLDKKSELKEKLSKKTNLNAKETKALAKLKKEIPLEEAAVTNQLERTTKYKETVSLVQKVIDFAENFSVNDLVSKQVVLSLVGNLKNMVDTADSKVYEFSDYVDAGLDLCRYEKLPPTSIQASGNWFETNGLFEIKNTLNYADKKTPSITNVVKEYTNMKWSHHYLEDRLRLRKECLRFETDNGLFMWRGVGTEDKKLYLPNTSFLFGKNVPDTIKSSSIYMNTMSINKFNIQMRKLEKLIRVRYNICPDDDDTIGNQLHKCVNVKKTDVKCKGEKTVCKSPANLHLKVGLSKKEKAFFQTDKKWDALKKHVREMRPFEQVRSTDEDVSLNNFNDLLTIATFTPYAKHTSSFLKEKVNRFAKLLPDLRSGGSSSISKEDVQTILDFSISTGGGSPPPNGNGGDGDNGDGDNGDGDNGDGDNGSSGNNKPTNEDKGWCQKYWWIPTLIIVGVVIIIGVVAAVVFRSQSADSVDDSEFDDEDEEDDE